jgi:hypothetical protein
LDGLYQDNPLNLHLVGLLDVTDYLAFWMVSIQDESRNFYIVDKNQEVCKHQVFSAGRPVVGDDESPGLAG